MPLYLVTHDKPIVLLHSSIYLLIAMWFSGVQLDPCAKLTLIPARFFFQQLRLYSWTNGQKWSRCSPSYSPQRQLTKPELFTLNRPGRNASIATSSLVIMTTSIFRHLASDCDFVDACFEWWRSKETRFLAFDLGVVTRLWTSFLTYLLTALPLANCAWTSYYTTNIFFLCWRKTCNNCLTFHAIIADRCWFKQNYVDFYVHPIII